MAWLSSVPKRDDKDKNEKRRIDTLPESHPSRALPAADRLIVECFDALGHCSVGGMGGVQSFTWQDVQAYSTMSAKDLTWWESEQLIAMSRAYCNMHHKAKKYSCKSPYQSKALDVSEIQKLHDEVDKKLDSFFK